MAHKIRNDLVLPWRGFGTRSGAAIWGSLVQFVMGTTAYWMFPGYLKKPGCGSARLAGLMDALYSTGLDLLLLSSLMGSVKTPLALGGRGLLASAVIFFGGRMLCRVVSYRDRWFPKGSFYSVR